MNEISGKSNIWMWASAALLCTTILGGYFALDYQGKLSNLQADYDALKDSVASIQGSLEELTTVFDLMIDYGNDTVVWYNSTRVPLGTNLLNATKRLVPVDLMGNYVTRINGVGGDGSGFFWLWHKYDGIWTFSFAAAHEYTLKDGDVVKWEYTDTFPF
jgi:hypothetical protein